MSEPMVAEMRPDWTPDRLKSWRLGREWSQAQAAFWAGVAQPSWSCWETGTITIPQWLKNRLDDQGGVV